MRVFARSAAFYPFASSTACTEMCGRRLRIPRKSTKNMQKSFRGVDKRRIFTIMKATEHSMIEARKE
jgi:hypothetical protein